MYTIQIDYRVDNNEFAYHGYPDRPDADLGLGYGRSNKQWQV